jgi:hypothetical protein
MNGHAMFLSGFIQTCQVIAVVIIRKETGGAIIASLNDMGGNTGQVYTWLPWHS